MRVSSLCLPIGRFALSVAVILLFSPAIFAQHSSSGGSSSSPSSSSSGGGGSHGGSSGGSAAASSSSGSSSGGHSSGATTSGRSSSGASSSHGSSSLLRGSSEQSSTAAPASLHFSGSNPTSVHSVREEKRSFFSFLRHPFKKPEPKPVPSSVAYLRRPICFRGPCQVCPGGQARVGGVCGGTIATNNARTFCGLGQSWNGIACAQTRFPEDCRALLVSLQQQQERMREADAAQRGACAAGPSQECSDVTSSAQNEAGAYRSLQDRYRICQQQSSSLNPFGHLGGLSYSRGPVFDPFEFDLDFR